MRKLIRPVLEVGTPEKFPSFLKHHVDRHCNLPNLN